MNWTPIAAPTAEDWFPAEIKRECEALAERIGQLLANRANFDRQHEEREAAGIEEFNPDEVCTRPLATWRVDCLRDELRIRQDLESFDDRRREAAGRARDEAYKALVDAEADVAARLIQFGYHAQVAGVPDRNAIRPDMIHRHPDVTAARDRHEHLFSVANSHSARQANEVAADTITAELERFRRQAVGV